jgi:acetyl esterase/lipase
MRRRFSYPPFSLRSLAMVGFFASAFNLVAQPDVIPLWDAGAPGFEDRKDEAEVGEPSMKDGRLTYPSTSNIHNPSLLVYLPEPDKATGAAVIIAPGGGHRFLTMGKEGAYVAEWLQSKGIAAFVLKYRLARTEGSPYNSDHCIEDGRRAVRLARSRSKEWNIDSERIGFMGFSAGGRPVLGTALHPEVGDPGTPDAISSASARPDFIILIYAEVPREYSLPANFPPTFMTVTWDDNPKVTPMTQLFLKLKEADVQSELHVYSRGGHGYGNVDRQIPVSQWPARLYDWIADSDLLK